MRKLAVSILIAGLPLAAGCSQENGMALNSELKNGPTSAASPSRQFYFGDTSDEGVVLGQAADYRNEKESISFAVPSGKAEPSEAASQLSREDKALLQPEPELEFKAAFKAPLSTFSADVDTASYSNVRRELQRGVLPHPGLVRVEEMLNYFRYDLPEPKYGEPFSVATELTDCPWSEETELLRVAIKTKSLDRGETPPRNLVFLLDVSGSMDSPDKLGLLKKSLKTLVDTLDDNDRVAIVVYAGASGVVLPSTTGDQKLVILESIERLRAGGSTNGESGIRLAYQVAEENRSEGSIDRVILATDGDFNVGLSSDTELKKFIEEKRESGLFLSVLGFGRRGNDEVMETLADNGNGNYASIDSLNEARKVLVEEAGATLVTVAKDVKFQVAFDPKQVESYRLIGYKNRRLADRDFHDDTKDAGELGAGHTVTALYELKRKKDPEQALLQETGIAPSKAIAEVRLRYKAPDSDESELLKVGADSESTTLAKASADHQWAAGVAAFGLRLEETISSENLSVDQISGLLQGKLKSDPDAYEAEFFALVKQSKPLFQED